MMPKPTTCSSFNLEGEVEKQVLLLLLAILVGIAGALAISAVQAQTQAEKQVTDIPLSFLGGSVSVIETTGACLYVYRGYGIAAISKATMPYKAGCR